MSTKTPDALRPWMRDGGHLPAFLRDFHDAKDFFKTIAEVRPYGDREQMYEVNWVNAQVYVCDRFLWFLALHGYTIQKCRTKREYYDLDQTLREAWDRRQEASAAALREFMATPAAPSGAPDAAGADAGEAKP